jgi:hypothetical protein
MKKVNAHIQCSSKNSLVITAEPEYICRVREFVTFYKYYHTGLLCVVLLPHRSSAALVFLQWRQVPFKIYSASYKRNPTKMKSQAGLLLCGWLSSSLPCDTRVKVTLVARPPRTPIAQKLWWCEHGVAFSQAELFILERYFASKSFFCCS